MADGTRIREPAPGDGVTSVDTVEVDFGAGDIRDRQRFALAGTDPESNVEVAAADPELDASGLVVRLPGGEVGASEKHRLQPYAKLLTADDTITPASGSRIELVWCQVVPNPDNASANLVTVRMTINGVLTDVYVVYAVGRSAVFLGDVDTPVVIDLGNSSPVTVNIHYREVA